MKVQKKIFSYLYIVTLIVVFIFSQQATVMAQSTITHYSYEYGKWNTGHPWKGKREQPKNALYVDGCNTSYDTITYNKDRKKTTVKLKKKYSSSYQKETITVTINNKTRIHFTTKLNAWAVCFFTQKIGAKDYAFLYYGDNDFAGGGVRIYEWGKNNKLKYLMSYQSKGYLDVFIAKDKKLNRNVVYIKDMQQFTNYENAKWPSGYQGWKNQPSTSVTKVTYSKYIPKNNKLKLSGKEVYYFVSGSYD